MASSFFEPGEAKTTTRQPATPAKREALLAILQAMSGRSFGGWSGRKPAFKPDLSALISRIQTDPEALTRIVQQSGRPASPSDFQNLSGGVMTLGLLGKLLMDEDSKGNTIGGKIAGGASSALDYLGKLLGLGNTADTAPEMQGDNWGMLPDVTADQDWSMGYGSGDGTYGVNQSDELDVDSLMNWLGY